MFPFDDVIMLWLNVIFNTDELNDLMCILNRLHHFIVCDLLLSFLIMYIVAHPSVSSYQADAYKITIRYTDMTRERINSY